MSFSEWSNAKKKKKEEEEKSSLPSSAKTSSASTGSFTEWSNTKKTGSPISGYNDDDASAGWDAFQKSQEEKRKKEEEKSWFEKALEMLGNSGDSTLPGANITNVTNAYRNDTSYREPSDNWSERQKQDFGFLYGQDQQKAFDYAEKVNNANTQAKKEQEKQKITKDAISNPVKHTVGALATAPMGLADYLNDMTEYVARGKMTEREMSPFEYSQTVTGGISKHLNEEYGTLDEDIPIVGGKGLGDVYGLGTSIAQSAIAGYTGGQFGTLIQFFGTAAASGIDEAKSRGATDDQALAYGTMAGAAEGLAEMIGVDNLFKIGSSATMREMLKSVLKQGAAEGIEEGLTSVMNNFADQLVMGDKSNFNVLVRDYMNKGWSQEEAKKQAWIDMAEDVAFDVLGGFVSGAVHAAPQTAYQTYAENRNYSSVYGESAMELVEQGLESKEGSLSHELAVKYQAKLNNGGTLTGAEINRLVKANEQEFKAEDMASIKQAAENRLVELGETQNTSGLAEILAKQATGQKLNRAEKAAIEASKYGQRVANEMNTENVSSGGYSSNWVRDIGTNRINPQTYNESLMAQAQEMASPKGNLTTAVNEVAQSVLEADTDTILEATLADMGVNESAAKVLMDAYQTDTRVKADVYAKGIQEAYRYGEFSYPQQELAKGPFSSMLTEHQRNTAYRLGNVFGSEQVAKAQEAVKAISKMETTTEKSSVVGKVHFEGDSSKLTARQSASISALETVADVMGVQIYVFESELNEAGQRVGANGWYDPKDNSIHIDLHAGAKGEGTMLFTAAHELTHHVKKWSPEKFKTLADFLMQEYGEKGVSVEQLVQRQIQKAKNSKSYSRELTYDQAFEEVIADSMESMLSDGNVVERLAKLKQQDRTLWEKIKDFISELAQKIREVYKGMTPDSPEGRFVAEMVDSIEKLQELFTEALVDASENYQMAEKNTTEDGGVDHYAVMRSDRIVDQIRSALPQIMALDSVYTIDASNATSYTSNRKTDEKSGAAVFKAQGGVANRPGFGRVVLSKRGAVHTVHHGNGPAKQAAFPAIKAVVEKGIEIYRDNNHDDRGYDTITFSAPITFFGEDAPLAVVVKSFEDANADKTFYIHEICDAEGNYIQMAREDSDKKTSSTNFVEPTSTVSAADGISPKNSIRNDGDFVKNESVEAMGIEVDSDTESVSPAILFSERTWTESDYVQEREKAAAEIAKAIGVSKKKAKDYIDSVNSIAKMIAEDRVRLDYFSSPGRSSFVGNVEYGGSFDFSTLCKKRRLLTGTFTAIQKALPNTALTADEILDIRNRMKEKGLEVSCGLCYVEGSRANMGQFAKEFLKLYKQYYPDAWQPNMADVNTPDGIEWVRINHPECYEQYEYFWNHYGTLKQGDKNLFASQQKPKLYQLHTEYKGEILEKFKDDDNVEEKNLNGGIRLQSFSDFEIVHLIDTMQIIMDMSRVGLAGQAYTKVPDFAWALGDTGLKINLSLIAKGVDANGKLIFDDIEGMPIDTAVELRNRYSKNVGTILVAFNDEQLLAAMADERVDFIIPFHRSQWKKSQYAAMGLPAKTKDYTYMQNEKFIKPQYHEYRGRMVKDKATNYMPNEYWDFSKSGKENAENYLEMCARNNKRPKFYKLLQNNGDGSYSLKADGSTDGYWKLLIDFKMYDNDGVGSPQMAVKPEFNMDEANRMLKDYQGGHSNFPVAQGIVDEFVKEYKDSHKNVMYSDRDYTAYDRTAILKESKVNEYLSDYAAKSSPKYAQAYIAYMRPRTFLKLTTDDIFERYHIAEQAGELDEERLSASRPGIYLRIDHETGEVIGHEGRHRMSAMDQAGIDYVPVLLVDTSNKMTKIDIPEITLHGQFDETAMGIVKDLIPLSFENRERVIQKFATQSATQRIGERYGYRKTLRFSDRDTESVSNRSLLANALEGVAQNDIERNRLQEYKGKISLIEAEERKLQKLNDQIKDLSFARGPKDTAKIRELQFEAKQTANRISTYDKQLLRLEASKPLQDVLTREKKMAYQRAERKGKEAMADYKAKAEKKQRETIERYRESKQKAVAKARETAEKRDAKAKLQKLVLDTADWVSGHKDTKVKCPDILKKPYAEFLESIDMSSDRLAKGGDPTKNDLRLANAMGSLATALERIMTSQDPNQETAAVLDAGYLDLPANFVQKLRDMTEDVKNMMAEGDYVVNTMTAEEVRKLSQMIRTLNHAIREMSTLYANLRFANVEALGDNSMSFMDALGEIKKTSKEKDFVQWENALPFYAFKRFGEGGESIFEGLMDAQDKLAFLARDIFSFQKKTWKENEAKKWSEDSHTITLPGGGKLTMTTADAMSIYCLSRRAQGLQHLLGGGVRVVGIQKGSQKAKDSRSVLTMEDIGVIISSLTDRQKKVAEAIQEFMSTTCSEWGNEISMKRFLTREFTEKFYFPIESNDENMPTRDPSAQQSDLFRLLNISATKAIDPRANNELIVRNIFDVFTGHASDMARLNAFGMPLLDYMKWLNYRKKVVNDQGQIKVSGVRKSMETAFGNAAKSYVLNLIKDVNGRPSDGGDPSLLMKWMRSAKTASVGSSLRVATLQITSYPRAALVLSPKSLALGLTKIPNIEKAKKYSGIALWKSFGFYDTNISRTIEEQMKGVKDVKQKMIEMSLKGAEIGDAITWGALWNACEYEVAATKKYQVGSKEFYEAVGKKLREVVYRTQVVDSTLTRSQMMRSKRGMAQEAAAFMSEPTLSANILMDAGMEFSMEKRRSNAKTAWKKTGKYVTGAVAVYAIGQLTGALLEALWDAWRDDEDEEFSEKYKSAFKENLILDLVPFNKLPIVSDVFEAVLAMFDAGYYSSDKMSTTWLTQAVSAADAWRDVLGGNSSVTAYNALYKSVRALSSAYGVAFSGVMREGVALWNNTAGAYDVTLKILNYDRSKAELGGLLLDAILEGNDRQADSLRAEFADKDAYQGALRTAIKNRYAEGEIDYDTALDYLVKYAGMDEDDAFWKAEEWEYEGSTGEDFSKYDELMTAVETGKNLKNVIKKYTDNGVKESTLRSQISEHFKPLYKEMSASKRAGIKGYLLNAMTTLGKTREDAEEQIAQWEYEAAHPDLAEKITLSQYKRWETDGKPKGVSVELFTDVAEYRGDGSNTKSQEEVAAYIDSLSISTEQKDALWCCFWKQSTLKNAPWH